LPKLKTSDANFADSFCAI